MWAICSRSFLPKSLSGRLQTGQSTPRRAAGSEWLSQAGHSQGLSTSWYLKVDEDEEEDEDEDEDEDEEEVVEASRH